MVAAGLLCMAITAAREILANVEITDPNVTGVIFAHGSRFGGHSLFLKDRKLHYVYNFPGIRPEQHFVSKTDVKTGKHTIGVEFTHEKAGDHGRTDGRHEALHRRSARRRGPDEDAARQGSLSGDGLCVGYDSGDAVSEQYKSPGRLKGGTIFGVGVTVEKGPVPRSRARGKTDDDGALTAAERRAISSSTVLHSSAPAVSQQLKSHEVRNGVAPLPL
jgi:arylsulfatase